ncbi:hypothetical protein V5O48_011333 [Marasmius crinis-equi]|uniref:Uncharacterized protein n=1 Tax=Marasmius crinis-equi TaxID=585013 RepID=A0ABR3F5X7_9AGAR
MSSDPVSSLHILEMALSSLPQHQQDVFLSRLARSRQMEDVSEGTHGTPEQKYSESKFVEEGRQRPDIDPRGTVYPSLTVAQGMEALCRAITASTSVHARAPSYAGLRPQPLDVWAGKYVHKAEARLPGHSPAGRAEGEPSQSPKTVDHRVYPRAVVPGDGGVEGNHREVKVEVDLYVKDCRTGWQRSHPSRLPEIMLQVDCEEDTTLFSHIALSPRAVCSLVDWAEQNGFLPENVTDLGHVALFTGDPNVLDGLLEREYALNVGQLQRCGGDCFPTCPGVVADPAFSRVACPQNHLRRAWWSALAAIDLPRVYGEGGVLFRAVWTLMRYPVSHGSPGGNSSSPAVALQADAKRKRELSPSPAEGNRQRRKRTSVGTDEQQVERMLQALAGDPILIKIRELGKKSPKVTWNEWITFAMWFWERRRSVVNENGLEYPPRLWSDPRLTHHGENWLRPLEKAGKLIHGLGGPKAVPDPGDRFPEYPGVDSFLKHLTGLMRQKQTGSPDGKQGASEERHAKRVQQEGGRIASN